MSLNRPFNGVLTLTVQSAADVGPSLSQHEQDLLSRLSPSVVCELIDTVFNELVSEFKVHDHTLGLQS